MKFKWQIDNPCIADGACAQVLKSSLANLREVTEIKVSMGAVILAGVYGGGRIKERNLLIARVRNVSLKVVSFLNEQGLACPQFSHPWPSKA